LEDTKFNESCKKIAVEMFYVFSQLHKRAKSN
jgi:hypothetical protein